MRRRVRRRQLLNGEQFHSLAKYVNYNYAKRGRMGLRLAGPGDELQLPDFDSGMHHLLASQGDRTCRTSCNPGERGIDLAVLEHISPIEREDVLLYGEHVIKRRLIQAA